MATKASGQITIVDLTDSRQLSVYLTSNLPKTQILDQDTGNIAPDWSIDKLEITPNIFLNQTAVSLGSAGLQVSYKRREGSGAESSLTTGETVNLGVLTVNQNKLSNSPSGLISYICYISYIDPETKQTVHTQADITYALVKNASSARLASVSGEQIFKYNKTGSLIGPNSITLNGEIQGVKQIKWKFKNSSGNFVDYPTTGDNVNITSSRLIVKPSHSVFVNETAVIKLSTENDDVYDIISISKLYDGADGSSGATGAGGLSIVVGNESHIISAEATNNHPTTKQEAILIPINAYKGLEQTSCTLKTPTNLPSGMTASQATSGKTINLTLTVSKGATLSNQDSGTIDLVISSNGQTITKKFSWAKSIRGINGQKGENAVVFSLYTPNGNVFSNQEGTLTINTQAYDGSNVISSGATYVWEKLESGKWNNVGSSNSLTVKGSDVINIATFKCKMTYKGTVYQDIVTLEDKSDPYTLEIVSVRGNVSKNNDWRHICYCKVFRNGQEIDPLPTEIFVYNDDDADSSSALEPYAKEGQMVFTFNFPDEKNINYSWLKFTGGHWVDQGDYWAGDVIFHYAWYLNAIDEGISEQTDTVNKIITIDEQELATFTQKTSMKKLIVECQISDPIEPQ